MRKGRFLAAVGGGFAALLLLAQPFGLELRLRENSATARVRGEAFWTDGAPGETLGRPDSVADLAQALSPAVVNIQTERKSHFRGSELFEEFFRGRRPRREFRSEATGSGFVISADGYIVTNNHVVEGADRITVVLSNGDKLEAEIVGRDPKTDLALLKTDSGRKLEVAPLGDSDSIRVGDWLMAIGNPFGLDHTVTLGILSARGRNINAGPYDDFLQTDASINPGNSGGPLIDMSGRVVGINTAINTAGQGIGFAIPINMAKELLPQLREFGIVTRGWLGVQIQRVNPALAKTFGLDEPKGALISMVFEDGPADKAKIKRGDVILEFDGSKIEEFDDLPRIVANTAPDTEVPLIVLRDGERKRLKAKLGKLEDDEIQLASAEKSDSAWGFEVEALTSEVVERLDLSHDISGVLVSNVDPDSSAARAGLQRGDVILEVNRVEVSRPSQVNKALEKETEHAVLLVQRGERTLYLAIERDS
ncbi:MAG: Do family serine endopeptidase [Myxococcota bacterium]